MQCWLLVWQNRPLHFDLFTSLETHLLLLLRSDCILVSDSSAVHWERAWGKKLTDLCMKAREVLHSTRVETVATEHLLGPDMQYTRVVLLSALPAFFRRAFQIVHNPTSSSRGLPGQSVLMQFSYGHLCQCRPDVTGQGERPHSWPGLPRHFHVPRRTLRNEWS